MIILKFIFGLIAFIMAIFQLFYNIIPIYNCFKNGYFFKGVLSEHMLFVIVDSICAITLGFILIIIIKSR